MSEEQSTAVVRKNYSKKETETILLVPDAVNTMVNPDGTLVIELVKHGARPGTGEAIVLRLAPADAPEHKRHVSQWARGA